MGLWGSFILGRADRPLLALHALEQYGGRLKRCEERQGGWQVWLLSGEPVLDDPKPLLADLTKETGAPALTGFVMDSDCVAVEALGRTGGLWRACLDRESMAAYLAEDGQQVDDWFLQPGDAAARAVGWAAEAGYAVAVEPLLEVLKDEADPFAEDLFFEFLTRLGLAALDD